MKNVKKQHIGYHLDPSSLYNLPIQAHIYWKDLDGCYLDSNDVMLENFGINSRQDLQGQKDNDFPLLLKEEADSYREEDKLVITHKTTIRFLDRATLPNTTIEFITVKTPIFDSDNNIKGIFGFSHYCTKIEEANLCNKLITYDFRKKIATQKIDNPFSKRQIDILKILCLGKTAKEIALALQLSPRTVEYYIENIKDKIHASSKSELIRIMFTRFPHLL